MKNYDHIVAYSIRILLREWKRYLLPLFSLFLTALVFVLVLNLTESASRFLALEAKALVGGDIALESHFPIDEASLLQEVPQAPNLTSQKLEFTGTIGTERGGALSVEYKVVDEAFPLYGTVVMEDGEYVPLTPDEIYIDAAASRRLRVSVGDFLYIGDSAYVLQGIILEEPDVLLNTFHIFPTVFLSRDGLARSGIEEALLRAEYTYSYQYDELLKSTTEYFQSIARENNFRLRTADGGGRLAFGLEQLTKFLVVAVLVTALLSAVNIYASSTFLLGRLQKSLAVLRAIGMSGGALRSVVLLSFLYILSVATFLGITVGLYLSGYIRVLADTAFGVVLLPGFSIGQILFVVLAVFITSIAAVIPALESHLRTDPKTLLLGGPKKSQQGDVRMLVFFVGIASLPFFVLASVLLGSLWKGIVTIGSVVAVYVAVALLYRGAIAGTYAYRHNFSFVVRSVLAQKRYDGIFGMVSFTSLFVALTALFVLTLTQASLEKFLTGEVVETVPSLYVIDVQELQSQALKDKFPKITLFPNVGARILQIDGIDIQKALAENREGVDRELRREFNVTYRTELFEDESISEGTDKIGVTGEVSVDTEFASRTGIELGSEIVFLVQGFEVPAVVTNLRQTNSRSGLPFFYFVFSPLDLQKYPATYFGYLYTDNDGFERMQSFLARGMPNVSVIDTSEVSTLVLRTIKTLLFVVFYVALPALILALLLIVVLIILEYGSRRRDGARLLALGAGRGWIERLYLFESVSTTLLSSAGAYLASIFTTWYVAKYFLELDVVTFYTTELLYGVFGLISGILLLGIILWRSDRKPLRELLAYESNH